MSLTAGTRLGPYEIVSLLGAGGMGEVYRARDPRLGREVAIKVLPQDVTTDAERLGRFEREARAVAALSHANILSIFDIGTDAGVTFAVTELLEGQTLRDRLAHGAIPVRAALDIAIQIARGLSAAHSRGLVHRDLKPENVFLLPDGHVKILDFGLALQMPGGIGGDAETVSAFTQPGTVMGSMGYMAPEQVRGLAVDARADLFALGAVMHELLSGRRAFAAPTVADTITTILQSDPPELASVRPDVPPAIDQIVRRCLEKNPAQRFQTAQDLTFALEQAIASRSAPMDASAAATLPERKRRSIVPMLIVAVAMLGAGVLIGRSWLTPPRPSLQPTFSALTVQSGEESWPSLSPDGTSFVYVSGASGNLDIYLRRLDGRNAINLTADSPANDTTPAFSPDGRFIAFRSDRSGGGLFVMQATGEDVKRLADQGYDPAWSADGKTIAFTTAPTNNPLSVIAMSQLRTVDVADGRTANVMDGVVHQPSWSPDGRRIAVWNVLATGHKLLQTVPVEGGPATTVFDTDASSTYWNPIWAPGGWLYFVSDESGSMNVGRVPINDRGVATGSRETIAAATGWAGQLTLSHDGRRLAYQAVSAHNALWRVALDPNRPAVVGEATAIVTGTLGIADISVSPDGQFIAFSSKGTAAPEDIYVVDRDGRNLRQLTNDLERDRGPSWLPDGSHLYFYSTRQGHVGPWSVRADGSDLRSLRPPGDDVWNYPRATPDGRMLMTAVDRNVLLTVTPSSSEIVDTLPPLGSADELFFPHSWSPDGSMLLGSDRAANRKPVPDVIIYRPATRRYERLAGAGRIVGWLPDNRRLVVLTDRLYVFDISTGNRTPVAGAPAVTHGTAGQILLADRGQTLYYLTSTSDSDIWLMTLAGR